MSVPSNEELAARIAAAEARLDEVAARRLALTRELADRTATARATNDFLQAMAITQGEHTQTLARHTAFHAEHRRAFAVTHDKLDLIIDLLQPGNNN